jgi:hypothetical protein
MTKKVLVVIAIIALVWFFVTILVGSGDGEIRRARLDDIHYKVP